MSRQRKREEIEAKYKWRLEDIYVSEESWEEDYSTVKTLLKEIGGLQGKLASSAETLLKVLQLSDQLERKAEKLYVYARMRRDENNALSRYQALFDRAESLSIEASGATAFMVPEILDIPEERLQGFLHTNKELAVYNHYFEEILRQKEHILSDKEERLLAMAADLSMASGNIFAMLNNADIKFPFIKDEAGEEVELTKGRYARFMESPDRRVRDAGMGF